MAVPAFETTIGYVKSSEIVAVKALAISPSAPDIKAPITGQWCVELLTTTGKVGAVITAKALSQYEAEEIRDTIIIQMGCFKLPF
jgi:hypothetical protein